MYVMGEEKAIKRERLEKKDREKGLTDGGSISVTRLLLMAQSGEELCTRLTIDMQKAFGLKSLPRATATPDRETCM